MTAEHLLAGVAVFSASGYQCGVYVFVLAAIVAGAREHVFIALFLTRRTLFI